MNQANRTMRAIAFTGALVAGTSANAQGFGEKDPLYRTRDLGAAAAAIAWGNEATRLDAGEAT